MEEILRRAMSKDAQEGKLLQERLFSVADELGISHESVLEAEKEYRVETQRTQELSEYFGRRRKDFFTHLSIFIVVNVFLAAMNIFTYREDPHLWFIYALFGWGIGIVTHAIGALSKPDWNDEQFQKWRKEQQRDDVTAPPT